MSKSGIGAGCVTCLNDYNSNVYVSIIIPVYNDDVGIRDTLLSLFKLDYPLNRFEIIVVDNNSTDGTLDTIRKTANAFIGRILVLAEKKTGSYAARNRGVKESSGEVIAFIDSNMMVRPDWLKKGIAHMKLRTADYMGCAIHLYSGMRNPSIWEKLNMALGFPVKDYMEIDGYSPTACLFIRRAVIDSAGQFDERLYSGGDIEFGTRVRDQGFQFSFDPQNVMYHPARTTLASLFEKQKRVISGQIQLRNLFPERFSKKRPQDVAMCLIQLLPVASPKVLLKLLGYGVEFLPLFIIFYMLRLHSCYLKLINRNFF